MKPNELRIGNIFLEKFSQTEIKVLELSAEKIVFEGDFKNDWQAEPAPLTEERILKCGFEKIGVNFQKEGLSIWYSSYAKCYQFRYCLIGSDAERKINIEYYHELQNLCFALKAIEL